MDFWTGYGAHSSMYNLDGSIDTVTGGSQQMILYFTALTSASVTVEIPATGWLRTYNVSANGVTESDPIPKIGAGDARIDSEGVFNQGIHITSSQPISVYCHIFDNGSSATSLLLPTNILGQNYTSMNFTQKSDNPISNSYCFIVATQDSTIVIVTPSVNTKTHNSRVPFTQILQKGQILNLEGKNPKNNNTAPYSGTDLTGTRIETENYSNSSGCAPIAVFSGSSSIGINCSGGSSTSDNLFQQLLPSKLRDKEFITVPTKNLPDNIYRIFFYDTGTIIKQNGVILNNPPANYYQVQTDQPSVITSNKAISVAQYLTSAGECSNTSLGSNGDPEMIFLTPVQQDLNTGIVYSTSHYNTTSDYVNIIKRTKDSFSVTLDNANIEYAFTPLAFDSGYAYAQLGLTPGIHQVHADSGFSAVAYGYGNLESYGYNVGFSTNVAPPHLNIQNPYANPSTPQTCNGTPFKISVSFPFQPTIISWDLDFSANPYLFPNTDTVINNPAYDSSYLIGNALFYRYSLPSYYNMSMVENFQVAITVSKATEDGCSDTAQYTFPVQVFQKPLTDWTMQGNLCENNLLQFTDNTNGFGVPLTKWFWNLGDGTKDSIQNPSDTYAAGNYNVSLRTINNIGCYDDTVKPIFISSIPVVNFGINGNDCVGNPVKFVDSSSIRVGTITQWYWDLGLGKGFSSGEKDFSENYYFPDTLNIKLFVLSAQNCSSDTMSKPWIVYPYPKVTDPLDTFVVEGGSVQLEPQYQGTGLHYQWYPSLYLNSDSIAYPITTTKTNTFYQETVTGDGGCVTKSTTYIYVIQYLDIPNAFSPNGDGINDKWIIKNIERYPEASVQVFNRYGQPVFISQGYYTPWDGTYNGGHPLPEGTYYYIINPKNKFVQPSNGYVVILR